MFKIVRRGLPIRIVEDIRDLWAFRFMSIAEEKGIEIKSLEDLNNFIISEMQSKDLTIIFTVL